MTRTGKAVEPMGFVANAQCGHAPARIPVKEYRLWVVPLQEPALCGGKKFRVVGFFDPTEQSEYGTACAAIGDTRRAEEKLWVCEHNGRLVE